MNVFITGVYTTQFGELWDRSPRALVREAVEGALQDAGCSIEDIDALYVGNMLSGMLGAQENLGAFYAEELGIHVPAFKIEGACASGGLAVHNGVLSILSGQYKRVLVVGVEKMTDHAPSHVASALMGAGSESERLAGLTFPGLYALMATYYMKQHKLTEEMLASVAVKNHYHGSLNDKAHFKKPVTIKQVLHSAPIADPLKLLDCSPISDGAAAVVLSSSSAKTSVEVMASAVATGSLGLHDRQTLTSIPASCEASAKAYKQANCTSSDIDVAEVHDCFSIAEIMALEDMGFYPAGTAGRGIAGGEVTLGSSKNLVVNTSGGLKACGHPVGATGVKQVAEIALQLRGAGGRRQVKDAQVGLTHNVGGSGAVAVVHILKK